MPDRSDAQAVLFTGAYCAGKTSLVEEIADVLEGLDVRYGAIDLDWLAGFDPGTAGRQDDLKVAKEWIASGHGSKIGDLVIENDGPIREIALEVISTLAW